MALVMGAPLLGEGESGVGVEVKREEAQPVFCCCAVLIHTPSCSTLRNRASCDDTPSNTRCHLTLNVNPLDYEEEQGE